MISFIMMGALLFAAPTAQPRTQSTAGKNVTVYFSRNISTAAAKDYLSVIDKMYSTDSDRFKIGAQGKMKVRLCADGFEFSNLTKLDSAFSPLSKDGILYVIYNPGISDPTFRSKLEAGTIRIILDKIHLNGAPWWLIHAASVYESGQYKDCGAPPVELVQYFSDLEEKIQNASTPSDFNDICFYLGATGKFFDFKYGAGSFVKLVQQFTHPTTIREAVQKLFRTDYERMEEDWHDFLASQMHG